MATKFAELHLHESVISAIEDTGYEDPTDVQRDAIPKILEGIDLLGIAQTGTGKTASYLLPLISKLANDRSRALMPRGLILCPTRELALQISDAFKIYSKNTKLTDLPIIGGNSYKDQERGIAKSPDIIIATPGRLLDHCSKGKILLSQTKSLVIDEGDRMLDMGFIPDIKKILTLLPANRQIMLFSATMPTELEFVARQILVNPFKIEITPQSSTSHDITQKIHLIGNVPRKDSFMKKSSHLHLVIESETNLKNSITFCNRKKDVEVLARLLNSKGIANVALHGNLTQTLRNKVLNTFSHGETKHLIASDVASRGLDIPEVSHVFNFDMPVNLEDYVHRIGRTGRAGKTGKAITICFEREKPLVEKIEALINKKIDREYFPSSSEANDGLAYKNSPHKKDTENINPSKKILNSLSEGSWANADSHIPDFLLKPTSYPKSK